MLCVLRNTDAEYYVDGGYDSDTEDDEKTYTGNKNHEIRAQENETSDKDRTSLHINTSLVAFSPPFFSFTRSQLRKKKKKTQNHGA